VSSEISELLSFEAHEALARWGGGPRETLALDAEVSRSGTRSGRLQREAGRAERASSWMLSLPLDFLGEELELRGWLRARDIRGWAGLWLRLDGPAGPVDFVSQYGRGLSGTSEWAQQHVRLILQPEARELVVGVQLVGEGTLWADELELWVDGRPLSQAPRRELPPLAAAWITSPEYARGSGIAAIELTEARTRDLALLGKVWGFAKYHHPRIVAGELNWDEQLLRVLPRVLSSEDLAQTQAVLSQWLGELGPPATPRAPPPDEPRLHLAPALGWLSDEVMLGPTLSAQLREIHARRPAALAQHYVSFVPGVGNPVFSGEQPWLAVERPDAGLRLLALLRLWNVVEYWFPYRDQLDEDWDTALAESLAPVCGADSPEDYALAMMALIWRVHDGHAQLRSSLHLQPPRGPAGLPVQVRFLQDQAVVAAVLGQDCALRPGDVLLSLDDTLVSELVSACVPWYPASNEVFCLHMLGRKLTFGAPGPVRLQVLRGDELLSLQAERTQLSLSQWQALWSHDHRGPPLRRLSPELAYLTMSSVAVSEVADYIRGAEGAQALVIDLRCYPSEFVVYVLGGHLVAEPTPFVRYTLPVASDPGAFVWGECWGLEPREPRFASRLAVLVDETTMSQAETTAMALRAVPGALVVGSQTAGADGNVSPLALPGRLSTQISGIGVFYPDGTPTQRVGLVPDLEVRPTVQGLRQGRDEVMQAAVFALLGREMTAEELAHMPSLSASSAESG
jgi:hypothetical protein